MSIFNTTANTGFNSFNSPWNPMNANQGGWGVDPNYLTPSYTAPYRPGYAGFQGMTGHTDPGFFRSASYIFNPFAEPPNKWGNPIGAGTPYFDSMVNRPADAAMWGAQNLIAPAIAAYGAFKLGNLTTARVGGAASFSGRMASSWTTAWGGSETAIAAAGARQGIFAAAGASLGRSTMGSMFSAANFATGGSLMGSGVGVAARGAMVGAGGVVGGLAGGLLLPIAAAQLGIETMQQGIFNPYVATSMTASTLRDNLANITFGGSGGNLLTGRGLSRKTAGGIASQVTRMGIKDYTLDEFSMGQVADLSSRSGLLDDSSIGQISGRIKDIGKLVKLMMNLTNDPDIKNNIETIVRLKNAGASLGSMSGIMQNIGFSSAISGISTQRMMNTVGAQGQYLAQANGILPVMGQIASANAMAGFASSYRTGLINKSTMAMMGGSEGATQSLVGAQINAGQTMYNRIALYNQHMGSGGSGVIGNLGAFGNSFARNPLGVLGAMELNDGKTRTLQMMDRGILSIQDQLMDMARLMPRDMIFTKEGKIDGNAAYTLMTRQMGMSADEARATLFAYQDAGDPKALAQKIAAIRGSRKENVAQYLNQQGLGNGIFNPMIYPVRQYLKEVRAGYGDMASRLRTGLGAISDKFEEGFYGGIYGKSMFKDGERMRMDSTMVGSGIEDVSQFKTGNGLIGSAIKFAIPTSWEGRGAIGGSIQRVMGYQSSLNKIRDVMDIVNDAGTGSYGADIQSAVRDAYDKNASPESRRDALNKLVSSDIIDFNQRKLAEKALNSGEFGRVVTEKRGTAKTRYSKLLMSTILDRKDGTIMDNQQKTMLIGQAHAFAGMSDGEIQRLLNNKDIDKNSKEYKAMQEFKKEFNLKDGAEIRAMADRISKLGFDNGLVTTATAIYNEFGDSQSMIKAIDKDPSKYFKGDQLARFKKGREGLTGINKADFYLGALGEARGWTYQDDLPDYIKHADKETRQGLMDRYTSAQHYESNLMKLAQEGKIDTSIALQSVAVNKMDQSIKDFGFYVERFGDKAIGRNGTEQVNTK